jgi:hypothetical protein
LSGHQIHLVRLSHIPHGLVYHLRNLGEQRHCRPDGLGLQLWALVINIEAHHSIKLLKPPVVNHYHAPDRGKGRISDPAFEIMDLHGLLKGLHIPLGQSSMMIVLIHMGSAVLVKSKILAVTTVVQAL